MFKPRKSFSFSNLSNGTHTVYFKVKDDFGVWSEPAVAELEIIVKKKPPEKPYYVRFWRKTKKTEKTDIFYISFSVENDSDVVVELINKEFDGFISKIFKWQYWYEVQLTEELFWGEVVEWVDKAFKGRF